MPAATGAAPPASRPASSPRAARAPASAAAAAAPSSLASPPAAQGRSLDRIADHSVSLSTCAAIAAGAIWSRMNLSTAIFGSPSSTTPWRGGQPPSRKRPAFV